VFGSVDLSFEEGVLGCLFVLRLVSAVAHDCVRPN